MFEEAAEQQAADFFHGVFWGKGDGCNKMVLLTAALYLAQKVLKKLKPKKKRQIKGCLLEDQSSTLCSWAVGFAGVTFTVWSCVVLSAMACRKG